MLVLTREVDEKIYIGEDVVITVTDIVRAGGGRHKVRFGIEAPKDLPVHRAEIRDKILRNEGENHSLAKDKK